MILGLGPWVMVTVALLLELPALVTSCGPRSVTCDPRLLLPASCGGRGRSGLGLHLLLVSWDQGSHHGCHAAHHVESAQWLLQFTADYRSPRSKRNPGSSTLAAELQLQAQVLHLATLLAWPPHGARADGLLARCLRECHPVVRACPFQRRPRACSLEHCWKRVHRDPSRASGTPTYCPGDIGHAHNIPAPYLNL
jgi:hypothetical protein